MAGEYLEWWDGTGASVASGWDDFESDPGVPSATQTRRLYNDKDGTAGASTESNWSLRLEANLTTADRLEGEDVDFVENGYFEVRITSSGEGDPTDWIALGPGVVLPLPPLASTEFVEIEARVTTPISEDTVSTWAFATRLSQGYVSLDMGHFESFGSGVVSGVGDSLAKFNLELTAVVQNPGGADDQVQVPDHRYIFAGVPYQELQQLVSIGTTDGAAGTPGGGESFIWAITADASGYTVTKGISAATPTAPNLPDGVLVTSGTQDSTGDILDSMIDNDWILGRFGQTNSLLTAQVHAGTGVVANALVDYDAKSSVTLTASSDNWIWLQRNGTFAVTTTFVAPAARAMPLYKMTTDGTGVTAVDDLRRIIGTHQVVLNLVFDTLTSGGGDFSNMAIWPHQRTGYIMKIALVLDGTGSGTGSNLLDVNKVPSGVATQTTIFTSQGTEDRRPTVASAASDPSDLTALPEVLAVEYGDALIAESDDIPITTQPSSATITVLLEVA